MKKAFTLAEVLITLAIIGVVAAISIPSVVANTQQKEFQTGLRKAVSVLNSAITMNMAIDGESPYENKLLYRYLGRHMSIMKSGALAPAAKGCSHSNVSFYTTDGMRFEFPVYNYFDSNPQLALHENGSVYLRTAMSSWRGGENGVEPTNECDNSTARKCSMCGAYGLNNNSDNTINPPCLVVVDVNGDRKPFPKNASCFGDAGTRYPVCANENIRKYADNNGLKLTDTFSIMVTDKQAIPYGVAAQRAMYQAQKSK